jgi:hypothetical protein
VFKNDLPKELIQFEMIKYNELSSYILLKLQNNVQNNGFVPQYHETKVNNQHTEIKLVPNFQM